jgi:single-stranded-DNA-specific exonuclease
MQKLWKILPYNNDLVQQLRQQLNINEVLCRLLTQRGVYSFESAKNYFRPSLSMLHDPFLMKDMSKAVNRIKRAIERGEKILIYGDYDVDGTTAVASMYSFLKKLHKNLEYYIPHRYREGYGVSAEGIAYAIKENVNLIISLDCGIKSVKLVEEAAKHGIDFIICDHHLPDEEIPQAVAILNAKQKDCPYPFKELCGCGVGIKLMQAISQTLQLEDKTWMDYLDLAAIAIAADIVPINGENRVLAYFGLKKVNSNPSIGVKALLEKSKMTGEIHINNLVFVIAPRVNAAGRMDDARKAVDLFIAQNEADASILADQLHADNTDRREIDASITTQAIEMIESDEFTKNAYSTLLYHPDWGASADDEAAFGKAKGVVGIVASRLIEKYYRPTIILTDSGGKVAGSARSVWGFNIYEAIHACNDLLENYGGHFYAAGLTLLKENVPALKKRFEAVVRSTIQPEMLTPTILIDSMISFRDITETFYKILCQMEPFGPENMRPVFCAKNVYETGESRVVKEQHIKFVLMQDGITMEGIGFGLASKFSLLQPNVPLSVVFTLDQNEWNGHKKLQLKVIDINQANPA